MSEPNTTESQRFAVGLAIALVVAVALVRVTPHPWNATPLVAVALFGGARFARAWWAGAVTLAALAVGDIALGLFPYEGMVWVYGASLLVVVLGSVLRRHPGVAPTLVAALSGGALFYVVTNFGVWATGRLYPNTIGGLVECYVAAIPFYRSQVVGDLAYTSILFGAFGLASRLHTRLHMQSAA